LIMFSCSLLQSDKIAAVW